MPEEAKELRDVLEEAYDKETQDDREPEEPAVSEPVAAAPSEDDSDGGGEAVEEETPEGGTAVEESEDEPGKPKFLPAEGDEALEVETPAQEPQAPQEPQERAPVAWRGAAKEEWANVPAPVREEVLRREREVNDVLRESSQSRQFLEAFERTIAPYREFIAAEGSDPLQSTRNLMQTAAVLRAGTPQQKAQTVAQIVGQFGVDIHALDDALAGQGAAGGGNGAGNGGLTPDVQQYLDQRLGPVSQFMDNLNQTARAREEDLTQSVTAEVDAFEADPAHVYYEDVREDMADLLDMANRRGQKMSLQEAYDRAVAMDPKLADLTAKKREAARAKEESKNLELKKRAAASLKGQTPAPALPKEPKDLRGAIERAWDNSGR